MSASKVRDALAAADMFLTALSMGAVPPCFTPKDEAAALGTNAVLPILRFFGPRRVVFPKAAVVKLDELRDLVRAALAEIEPTGKAPS